VPCPLRSHPLLVSLCLSPGLATAALAAGTGRAAQRSFSNRVVHEPVHVSQGVMQGLLIKKIAPNYPPLALQARIGGAVILNVEISRSGDVVNTSLFSGHPMPAAAAVRSCGRRATPEPATRRTRHASPDQLHSLGKLEEPLALEQKGHDSRAVALHDFRLIRVNPCKSLNPRQRNF
jgi:hypothetical protein